VLRLTETLNLTLKDYINKLKLHLKKKLYKDDKKIRKFKKIPLIDIWPTYALPVRTEAGLSRGPGI
jgi:hypothetical protein